MCKITEKGRLFCGVLGFWARSAIYWSLWNLTFSVLLLDVRWFLSLRRAPIWVGGCAEKWPSDLCVWPHDRYCALFCVCSCVTRPSLYKLLEIKRKGRLVRVRVTQPTGCRKAQAITPRFSSLQWNKRKRKYEAEKPEFIVPTLSFIARIDSSQFFWKIQWIFVLRKDDLFTWVTSIPLSVDWRVSTLRCPTRTPMRFCLELTYAAPIWTPKAFDWMGSWLMSWSLLMISFLWRDAPCGRERFGFLPDLRHSPKIKMSSVRRRVIRPTSNSNWKWVSFSFFINGELYGRYVAIYRWSRMDVHSLGVGVRSIRYPPITPSIVHHCLTFNSFFLNHFYFLFPNDQRRYIETTSSQNIYRRIKRSKSRE